MKKPLAYDAILAFAMLLQAAITFMYAVTLHYQLKTSAHDLLSFAQPLHNLINGHGFTSSVNYPYLPQHWFGYHFSPILYALLPLYWLFPHVEMFLAVGSISVALAAWPLYLLGHALLGTRLRGLCVALMYLFNPFVVNGVLWNFHEVDFAPLAFAWGLWAVHSRKPRLLISCCVALLSIKEHYGLAVAGFGALWAWHWQERRFGIALAAAGIATIAVVMTLVMPHFNPTGQLTMVSASSEEDRYSWLTSMEGIKTHIDEQAQAGLWYGLKLLVPFLLLPLASFAWLLPAAADVAVNVLSLPPLPRSGLSYHSLPVLPMVAVAFCHTASRLFTQKLGDIILAAMMATVCFTTLFIALPYSTLGNIWELQAPQWRYSEDNAKTIKEINALMPQESSVSGQVNVLPHLPVRERMIPFPALNEDTEFVVLQLESPFNSALYVFSIPFAVTPEQYFSDVQALLNDKGWGAVYFSNHWLVLKRGAKTNKTYRENALKRIDTMRDAIEAFRSRSRLRQNF